MGYGWHWCCSSLAGLVLTGQYRPLCSSIHAAPDCMARRAAVRALGRVFDDPEHTRRIHDTWLVGRALRVAPLQLPHCPQHGFHKAADGLGARGVAGKAGAMRV